jgi:hypothetical protein
LLGRLSLAKDVRRSIIVGLSTKAGSEGRGSGLSSSYTYTREEISVVVLNRTNQDTYQIQSLLV